jgi:hypothetical protein
MTGVSWMMIGTLDVNRMLADECNDPGGCRVRIYKFIIKLVKSEWVVSKAQRFELYKTSTKTLGCRCVEGGYGD